MTPFSNGAKSYSPMPRFAELQSELLYTSDAVGSSSSSAAAPSRAEEALEALAASPIGIVASCI